MLLRLPFSVNTSLYQFCVCSAVRVFCLTTSCLSHIKFPWSKEYFSQQSHANRTTRNCSPDYRKMWGALFLLTFSLVVWLTFTLRGWIIYVLSRSSQQCHNDNGLHVRVQSLFFLFALVQSIWLGWMRIFCRINCCLILARHFLHLIYIVFFLFRFLWISILIPWISVNVHFKFLFGLIWLFYFLSIFLFVCLSWIWIFKK